MVRRSIVWTFFIFTSCIAGGGAQYDNCTDGNIADIGNGWCDSYNNNKRCLYDGGDCCECISIDGGSSYSDTSSSYLLCVDPSSSCYSPTAAALQPNCTDGDIAEIGNGWCDDKNNNEGCLYDGGDCCSCTCRNGPCYNSTFFCADPSSPCYNSTAATLKSNCTDGIAEDIGDGWCDSYNNNEECLFDGSDCCSCTCVRGPFYYCGSNGFSCLDPEVDSLEPYICEESQPSLSTCPAGLQQEWMVENTIQARALAEAVRCSGGSFDVMWKGKVMVDKTISILDGTVLNVTSISTDSAIVGDGKTRLFSVVNASLHTSNITVSNGNANYGGAIAASHSRLSFNGVAFTDNTVTHGGGALHFSNGTTASFVGDTTFLNNTASNGGALCVIDGSNVSWTGNTVFSNNVATSDGGALYLDDSSSAVWTAEAHFLHNSADDDGGALYLYHSSSAFWTAESHYLNNSAGWEGGALYLYDSSNAFWTAKAHFHNNSAGYDGGALHLDDSSSAVWTAEAHFLHNSADDDGGALYLYHSSSADWTAEAHFLNNSAGYGGGALFLSDSSSVIWTAEAHFLNNSAEYYGGALFLDDSSNAVWAAEAQFFCNSAGYGGGALSLRYMSSAAWTSEAQFVTNSAGYDGGAVYIVNGCNASWRGETNFSENTSTRGRGGALYVSTTSSTLYDGATSSANWTTACNFARNSAGVDGGAIYADESASLSWSNKTLFVENIAHNGGAFFASNGVNAQWTGETSFISNYASLNGGAVGYVSANKRSVLSINGATSFENNTCGGNGGAMSLVNSLPVVFHSKNIVFLRNSAGASGGAVSAVFAAIGIVFKKVKFVGNSAQIGGAVHSTGSGTEVTVSKDNKKEINPMTFDGCSFLSNYAIATGGAVDSASCQNVFVRTSFEGNKAKVGGALRLAGIASIENCSFEDNTSELDGGPAVANVGYISNVTNIYLNRNVFKCKAPMFLDFNELSSSDDPFETVCDGCPSKCFGCSYGDGQGSPTCTSLLEAGMKQATSKGGFTTVEGLIIHKGYWRATNTSRNILRCFNTKACEGGLTGASDYCFQGYEGPYCSVCSKNYVSSLRFTCRECPNPTVSITIAILLTALALVVGFVFALHLVSTKVVETGRGIIDRVTERIPLQSVKIIITVWQILTQFTSVANVKYSNVYQTLLDGVNFFNFDLSWVVSAGCFLHIDFHDRLLWTTLTPLAIVGLLRVTYAITVHRNIGSRETIIGNVQHKYISMALLVTFLVYSSVSSVVFQMFGCDDLDDGKSYLRADYTIDCDSSKHRVLQIYSGLMVIIYPVGIPVLYARMLFSNRHVLRAKGNREGSPVVRSITTLWKPYKPQRFYYEVFECARRILLTGVIVFIYPNSAAQVAATFAIAVVFIFVSEGMAPYESPWDAWISRMGQAIIFASMYLALLLKVNVSGENDASQKMFEVILVACHACMILAVILQVVIMAISLRAGRQQEDPRPRLRRPPGGLTRVL